EQRILDRGHRLLVHPARRLARDGIERRHDALDGPRILPDQARRHTTDHGGETRTAVAFIVLRPADQPVIVGDFQEREIPPAGVAVQILDFGDFHAVSSAAAASINWNHAPGRETWRFAARECWSCSPK